MPFSRRKFIKGAGLITSSLALNQLESFSHPVQYTDQKPGFELKMMATNWGFPGDTDSFCKKAKKEGYDGIEVWVPAEEKARSELRQIVEANGLLLGLLAGGSDSVFQKHQEQFSSAIKAATAMKPVYINCHSGRDYFSFDQNKQLVDITTKANNDTGVPIYHETHRGRALFAAHITRNFAEKIKELRLTFDVSHWCNVHESLLADQTETLDIVLPRVDHIHARIGHPEGPQVNDPRAPEWLNAVNAHFSWWDNVIGRKKKEGKMMTILTEFGPPDYMPTLPYTRQPLGAQWEINAYMMQLLRKRYAS